VHPRLGVVDVVPFVPLAGSTMQDALAARDEFAVWAAEALGVPCFFYGPERSLPEVRQGAWNNLSPDAGPPSPHPTAGAICVGARPVLVAYNVELQSSGLAEAKRIAALIRGTHLRALGLQVGDTAQVSMNLIDPALIGPAQAYDAVARLAEISHAELVGLIPEAVLSTIPRWRWAELDLAAERTIEWRLQQPLERRMTVGWNVD
jgi:glutamate formiminotransferase